MYRQCPVAIIAAREDEALTHGQVLYGLIKPTKDMSQVESTAAMVNVIPKKRIYRMEKPEEIDLFLKELMKRPLVLQPSAYIGRGLSAIGCALCTNEERWITVINQSHPKIMGRLQAGIDTARAKMARGEPFLIKLSFNEFLKRVYLDTLTNTALDARFTFIDFEDADIVIRYPGQVRHIGTGQEIAFTFDDILPSEITRRTVGAASAERQDPALRIVMPDELVDLLPGWQFEMIDPLEGVGNETVEEDGAVGGVATPAEAVQTQAAPTGRMMGRAQRKGKAGSQKQHVPVELHVPEPEGQQMLHRGHNWQPSPSSPVARQQPSAPAPAYEDLHRGHHVNEHEYERAQVHTGAEQNKHLTAEVPYEEMNVRRQQYSPNMVPSPQVPYSPRTPTSPGRSPYQSPSSPAASRSPHTPNMPHSPRTPNIPHSPRTPNMSSGPHTPQTLNAGPRTPQTLNASNLTNGSDRYNQERIDSSQVKSPKQTYLTDDDDGGFSSSSPRGLSPQHNKYDTNYNRSAEVDRYGNRYDSSDRYTDQTFRPVAPPRQNFPPSSRTGVSSRGLHHHQGSGRSDTSTSDSGFGETDESRHRNDKYNNHVNQPQSLPKTPYYNHAYEQESPERDRSVVDDIMAKHKAMAAQVLQSGHQQGHGKQEFNGSDSYGRELQKWRRNINDLEDACDVPQSDFASTRLRVNSHRDEPVEESFI